VLSWHSDSHLKKELIVFQTIRLLIVVTMLMLIGTYSGSPSRLSQSSEVLAAQSRKPQRRAQVTSTPSDIVGIKLGGASLCNVELFGVPVKTSRVYGHKADVIKVLDGALFGKTPGLKCAGPCPCALDNVGECLFRGAPKVEGTGNGTPPPPPPGNR
jgi:hypothetical protein